MSNMYFSLFTFDRAFKDLDELVLALLDKGKVPLTEFEKEYLILPVGFRYPSCMEKLGVISINPVSKFRHAVACGGDISQRKYHGYNIPKFRTSGNIFYAVANMLRDVDSTCEITQYNLWEGWVETSCFKEVKLLESWLASPSSEAWRNSEVFSYSPDTVGKTVEGATAGPYKMVEEAVKTRGNACKSGILYGDEIGDVRPVFYGGASRMGSHDMLLSEWAGLLVKTLYYGRLDLSECMVDAPMQLSFWRLLTALGEYQNICAGFAEAHANYPSIGNIPMNVLSGLGIVIT
ncbi:MAG: hypothetical protein GY861_20915 [bacterium]|nr:hypothetical protein [bacterium]